jgi:Tol biopolymer transport system component
MSADGKTIASARLESRFPNVVVIQTYSFADNKWTDRKKLEDFGGGIAISRDGSKLAFVDFDPGATTPARIHYIDLKTGSESVSAVIGRYRNMLSWSPDGSRIVYHMNQSPPSEGPRWSPGIFVLNTESDKITRIADGEAPSWSPSGEWIAYFERSPNRNPPEPDRVWLVRPDGTDARLVGTLRKGIFHGAAVWSPDSKTLLLSHLANADLWTFDIYLLDLTTLKLTRKFKGTWPVHGWAEAK